MKDHNAVTMFLLPHAKQKLQVISEMTQQEKNMQMQN